MRLPWVPERSHAPWVIECPETRYAPGVPPANGLPNCGPERRRVIPKSSSCDRANAYSPCVQLQPSCLRLGVGRRKRRAASRSNASIRPNGEAIGSFSTRSTCAARYVARDRCHVGDAMAIGLSFSTTRMGRSICRSSGDQLIVHVGRRLWYSSTAYTPRREPTHCGLAGRPRGYVERRHVRKRVFREDRRHASWHRRPPRRNLFVPVFARRWSASVSSDR